jgi:glycosyltransferase involved in cell wall biosynthesis
MLNDQLKISVVIPLYNKAEFVSAALDSIFIQTYPVHEIIIVDDGSTDDSLSVVKAISHPSIRIIQQKNAGVSVARNVGMQVATGDLIAFLDADDRFLRDFFASIVRLAQNFPDTGLLATGYRRFSDNTPICNTSSGSGGNYCRGYVNNFYANWCKSSFFFTSSLAVRSSALRESGISFPAGERLGEDQDVWFQFAERYPMAFDPEVHSEYRVDVAGSATNKIQLIEVLPCYQRLADRIRRNEVPPKLLRSARRLFASHLLNLARTRLSVGDIKGAWRLLLNPMASANITYFIRTSLLLSVALLGIGVKK